MDLLEITAMDAYLYLPLLSLKGMICQWKLVEGTIHDWWVLTFH